MSGVNDADSTNEDVTVSLSALGGGYAGKTASVSVTVTDDDTANLVVDPTTLPVGEDVADFGTFTVRLATGPTATVRVSVSSGDTDAARVSPASLSFSTSNWNRTQTVTVRGVDDDDATNETVSVSLSALGGGYAGKTASVSVTVTDDDTANLVVDPTTLTVGEDVADFGTFTVKLATQPTANVAVTLSSGDTMVASVSPATLSFTTSNWNTAQTVTVSGVNDADSTNEDVTVSLSALGGGYAGKTASVSVTVTDDDTANLVVDPTTLPVGEDAADFGTFTVRLATEPTDAVRVSVSSGDTDAASVSPANLSFSTSNWKRTQTVAVRGVDDDDTSNEEVTVSLSASGGGYGGKTASVLVTVTDNDAPPTPTDVPLLVIQAGGITLLAGYQAPADDYHYQLTLSWSLDGSSSSYQSVVSHDVDESATTQEFPGDGNPIARPGYYKVGLRACRDEARTDDQCGEYAESQPLLFPTLALPTIEVDSNDRNDIKLVDGYRLPPPAFTYKIALFLESSIVSTSETPISSGNYPSLTPMAAGAYQVGITACDPATGVECVPYVLSTQSLTKLAPPGILDVVPRYKREAMLVWRGVDNATEYKVEARDPKISNNMPMAWNDWNPLDTGAMPDCRIPPAQTAYECHIVVDLDSVITPDDKPRGLAHAETYEVRVTATNPSSSYLDHSSESITIIDTPIYRVDGYNTRGTGTDAGEALIKWRAPSPAAQAGSFRARYRKARQFAFVGVPHTDPAWIPGTFDPPEVDEVMESSEHTIEDLTLREIYAVQLYYTDRTGKQVYTARDAYVWPSDDFPPHNERVATFPFFGYFQTKTYDYRVCDEDEAFPDDDPNTPVNEKNQWVALIEHALGQWETATKDGDDKLITMSYNDGACTDLSDLSILNALLNDADDGLSEVRIFDLALGTETYFMEMLSDPFKLCILGAYACVTSRSGYLRWPRQADYMLPSADITLNLETIRKKLLQERREPKPIMPDSVAFNACRENGQPTMDDNRGKFFVYALLVHEAGHALGLSDWSLTETARQQFQKLVSDLHPSLQPILLAAAPLFLKVPDNVYEVSHPTIADSVMSYDRETPVAIEHDCSPHPFDIMALHALYQNVNR